VDIPTSTTTLRGNIVLQGSCAAKGPFEIDTINSYYLNQKNFINNPWVSENVEFHRSLKEYIMMLVLNLYDGYISKRNTSSQEFDYNLYTVSNIDLATIQNFPVPAARKTHY
jgi:hypothetical protein